MKHLLQLAAGCCLAGVMGCTAGGQSPGNSGSSSSGASSSSQAGPSSSAAVTSSSVTGGSSARAETSSSQAVVPSSASHNGSSSASGPVSSPSFAPSSGSNPASGNADVTYDFPAGDTLDAKDGWTFTDHAYDVALAPMPGTQQNALTFTYPAAAGGDNAGPLVWVEQRFEMPPSDEFYLRFRLHIPANYRHRFEVEVRIPAGQRADWMLGDVVQAVDGQARGIISGVNADAIFLRNPPSPWDNALWVGQLTNVTRNSTATSTGRAMISSNRKLLAIWADGYSSQGLGPTLVWEFWNAEAPHGETATGSDLAVHYAPGNHTGGNEHVQHTPFIRQADHGRYLDVMVRGKFSSALGVNDGVIQTWFRREGESAFTMVHDLQQADIAKRGTDGDPGTLVPWHQGYLMGWANAGYDEVTTFHISRIEHFSARPAELP